MIVTRFWGSLGSSSDSHWLTVSEGHVLEGILERLVAGVALIIVILALLPLILVKQLLIIFTILIILIVQLPS